MINVHKLDLTLEKLINVIHYINRKKQLISVDLIKNIYKNPHDIAYATAGQHIQHLF
jgi:hypothetical protein